MSLLFSISYGCLFYGWSSKWGRSIVANKLYEEGNINSEITIVPQWKLRKILIFCYADYLVINYADKYTEEHMELKSKYRVTFIFGLPVTIRTIHENP